MTFRYTIIVFTAAALTLASAAAAEGESPLERGTITFGLASGGWHRYSITGGEGSYSVFTLSPLVGIFAADRIWLGGGVTIAKWEFGEGYGSESGASVHGGLDYHFLEGKWTPFVGFWGLLGDYPGDGVMARLGARFFVVPQTSLGFGYDGAVVLYDNRYNDTTEVNTSHRLWYGFQLHF
ncbi:MAG: hypothetical protein JSU81_01630 [Candidatus Coatesbacteria bacterium]|nr:MAG: hypothetical protein JSU81_01630 [Candidatus Coatesbacteria bacterium]